MILKSLRIQNFRSIEEIAFQFEEVNNSKTYTLLGINESGKSSILSALALFDSGEAIYPNDFHDDAKDIIINLIYELENNEVKELKEKLKTEYNFDKYLITNFTVTDVSIQAIYKAHTENTREIKEEINFNVSTFPTYTLIEKFPTLKEKNIEAEDFDLLCFFAKNLDSYFYGLSHHIVFWKSIAKYLILDEIDLATFSEDPSSISVPLENCFLLSGLKNIKKEIQKLSNPVSMKNLESRLSDKVTEHINKVWPEHEVVMQFVINNNKLSFLVEDKGVQYQAKTTSQRSDGFRQFISFLLTVSAENLAEELSNSILILDEPETHLHPTAQINLMQELIKITSNNKNNIVFFATHSNYMIDKENIERCYKVIKQKNHKTTISKVEEGLSTYAEVNYKIFQVSGLDYHNELYGFIEERDRSLLEGIGEKKVWKNLKNGKEEKVSLSTYIRHSIHHPENKENKKFSEKELNESITILEGLKRKF